MSSAEPEANIGDVTAALVIIPNDDLDWESWNNFGMATWRATGGDSFEAFDAFSQKSTKYDPIETRKRWDHYHRSPPTRIGAGTIFFLADKHQQEWEAKYFAPCLDPNNEWLKSLGLATNDNAKGEASKAKVKSKPPQRTLDIVCLADVQTKQIEWLWPGRIAKGKVTVVAGHPGIGKSMAGIDIAARISTGATWPCGEGIAPKGSVIILTTEDDAADTIKPRILAASGDVSKVHHVQGVKEADGQHSTLGLGDDLDLLEQKAVGDVVMIQIDPANAYMPKSNKNFDSYRDTDIRSLFEPIQAMATRLKIAIWVVTHFNKAGGDKAMMRFLGSVGMLAMARAAYAIVEDPDDRDRRLMLPVKNNLGATKQGFAYHVHDKPTGDEVVPYCYAVEWENDHVTITADEALAPSKTDGRKSEDVEKAKIIIREALANGQMPAKPIEQSLAVAGIGDKSVRNAKKALGVKSIHTKGNIWLWFLPSSNEDNDPM